MPIPRVNIVGVIHYKAPDDSIIGFHTMCGINKVVSAEATHKHVTCRTCKVLVNYVVDGVTVVSDITKGDEVRNARMKAFNEINQSLQELQEMLK